MLTVARDELDNYVDRDLPPTDWLKIDQQQINAFADATLDHQFIHVDPGKAAQSPFGSTIAHGYLTLSLVSHFLGQGGIAPSNVQLAINYGSNKVRFLEPVRVDSEVRGVARLLAVREKLPGQVLLTTRVTVEIKGSATPALIAEILSMFVCAKG